MKLKKVHVKNYRSVEDSQQFEVGGVTCLVGKNEAGKTAILQALATLRPHDAQDAEYNKVRDYPRRFLNDYEERHEEEDAIVTETQWEMSDHDKKALESVFGSGFVTQKQVELSGGYSGKAYWSLEIDQSVAVKHLMSELDTTDQSEIKDCKSTEEIHEILSKKQDRSEKQSKIIQRISEYKDKSAQEESIKILSEMTPRFLYFSHYDRMNGQVSIEKLREDKQHNCINEGDQVFLDFLEYAGTNLDEIASATTYEDLNSRCEAASNKITDQLMEYWKQNPYLEVEVRLTKAEQNDPAPFNQGTIARARVKNTLHRVSVPFSERSAGFIWFFSFLVKFTQAKKSFGNVIILLDEPGLTLHGKAQEDLLRYFKEKLEPKHQIVFSTHSPFMVPVDRLEDVRIVEDVIEHKSIKRPIIHGTKVSADVMANDPDTLFPLQGALGYELAQHLFVSPHNLVVEGTSDYTYLSILSSHLKELGKTGLDDKWSIIPVGGADMVPTFVALLGAHLDVTVLVDSQKAGHQKLNKIADRGLLKKSRILMIGDILDTKLADIEDLFSVDDYLYLYNIAFEDVKVDKADLNGSDPIVTRITRFLDKKYDHGKPADVLMRNKSAYLKKLSNETVQNFENMFIAINKTIAT